MAVALERDPLAALESAVDGVLAFFEEAPSPALGAALLACRRQQDRLEAGFARGTARFDANREYAADGAVSTVSWLKANARMSGGAAAERLNIGRQMEELPEAAEAAASGKLGFQHLGLIARTAGQVGSDLVREQQSTLLTAAGRLNPNDFSLVTRHLRNVVDPDGALKDANRAYELRSLHLSPSLDGIYFLDGRLDPESGAVVETALNALMKPVPDDERSASQRRCDALVEICRRQAQNGSLPQVHGVKPHLTVTVSAAALAGVAGAKAAELGGAGPIALETLKRLACDAAVSVIALDDRGSPLDAGRTTRTTPPPLLRALSLRDGGCRWPGCDRPIAWTDSHHRHHWTEGGETKLNNLLLLCRFHHRKAHEGRWQLIPEQDGSFTARGPDGRLIMGCQPAARSA